MYWSIPSSVAPFPIFFLSCSIFYSNLIWKPVIGFLFNCRGSSLPAILFSSPVSPLLTPKTMSILISIAFGMLLSDKWMACRVLLLAKGHCIRLTLSLKFIPDRLISINFEEVLIRLTRGVMKPCSHSSFDGTELLLRFRYWIYAQFSLITSIKSESCLPWMLILDKFSS